MHHSAQRSSNTQLKEQEYKYIFDLRATLIVSALIRSTVLQNRQIPTTTEGTYFGGRVTLFHTK